MFVLGDSHAGAYSPMLHKLSNEYGINLIKLSSPGCEVANFMRPGMSKSEKCTVHCTKHNIDIIKCQVQNVKQKIASRVLK